MQNFRERVLEFWGRELEVIPAETLKTFGVNEFTARLLQETGLPVKGQLTQKLRKYLNLEFYQTAGWAVFSLNNVLYLVIAGDPELGQVKICIRLTDDAIYGIALFDNLKVSFINSNLEAFLIFLELYITYWCNLFENGRPGSGAMLEAVARLEFEFRKVDVEALADDNFYWHSVLEDNKLYHAGFIEEEE